MHYARLTKKETIVTELHTIPGEQNGHSHRHQHFDHLHHTGFKLHPSGKYAQWRCVGSPPES